MVARTDGKAGMYLGYDPGGVGANGVAAIDVRDSPFTVHVKTCDSVDEVIEWFRLRLGGEVPAGIGIDAFLSWSTGISGWRDMDERLRRRYAEVQQSVFSSNSASGSMAVQGMALAVRARESWPEIALNETHPKLLYFALTGRRYSYGTEMQDWLAGQLGVEDVGVANDHEWDALISAWATWMGLGGKWKVDLMSGAAGALLKPAGEINYFWPESV